MIRLTLCAACVLALVVAGSPAQSQTGTLTNDDVVKLAAAGLGDDLIITTIRGATAANFDLNPEGLVSLKASGLSDNVLAAMIEKSLASNTGSNPRGAQPGAPAATTVPDASDSGAAGPAPGIYVVRLDGTRTPLEPTNFSAGSGSRWKSRFTFGFAKDQSKASVPLERAVIRTTQQRPTFLFVFPVSDHGAALGNAGGGWWFGGMGATMSSPNQFALAQFFEEENRRELIVGESNDYGVSSGPHADALVPFTFDRLEPGVYEVTPTEDLGLGEFCFFPLGTAGAGNLAGHVGPGSSNVLFDFGVDAGSR